MSQDEIRDQIIRNEIISIINEKSMDNGYKSIRVGRSTLLNELTQYGVTDDDVKRNVTLLVMNGYLLRNGAHTVDINPSKKYPYQRDPAELEMLVATKENGQVPEFEPVEEVPAEKEQADTNYGEPVFIGVDMAEIPDLTSRRVELTDELDAALANLAHQFKPVSDIDTKLKVLGKLSEILDPSISKVLADIATDIKAHA